MVYAILKATFYYISLIVCFIILIIGIVRKDLKLMWFKLNWYLANKTILYLIYNGDRFKVKVCIKFKKISTL